jgi:hypothetical protein
MAVMFQVEAFWVDTVRYCGHNLEDLDLNQHDTHYTKLFTGDQKNHTASSI